ncbi:glycosyltransferase family 39 protein [Ephemerocybe angulata]|uniref:Dolichyl-phosphate-mannose--protein mannosyltransferase n=1 Tax=Ephemerocybe angulata TaxID=980116 RepID=A0A8H6IG65_9AGAR|nr:glycosyltransferase family 39 protein [Tulosesus angulatus]
MFVDSEDDIDGSRACLPVIDLATIGSRPRDRHCASIFAPARGQWISSKMRTEFLLQNTEVIVPVVYTLLSCRTRFHRIGASNTVIRDEAHFGKFGSHYLKREFYFDVHPPLGKMLVGLAGLLSGYGGSFEFKSGEVYSDTVPYVATRVMLATFGVLMVPLPWFTSVELGTSQWACHLTTLMVLLEVYNEQFEPFSFAWCVWLLVFAGISIGCVTNVKIIGLVVKALVGVYTSGTSSATLNRPDASNSITRRLSGPGDSQMISLFQANLEGDDFRKNPHDVAFGSSVTLKNTGWGGGLLHSHDGDTIRLSHVPTSRNLHSYTVTATVSKLNYEVSGYGNLAVGDNHDYWQVEIVGDTKMGSVGQVHSLTTRMRFKHVALGCYLRAANAVLPQWGFKQIEVSCDKENNKKDAHTYWNVESHWNDRLPAGDMKLYKSPFLCDFWHLNVAMMTSNNALIPDPDKEDILASKPFGLRMCGTISLGVALLTFAVYILRWQRKYNDMDAREWDHFLYVGKTAFFEWAFHYVPFLIIGRVTYLHHYLPTLYFAVLMFGHVLDHFIFSSRRFSTRTKATAFGVLVSILVATFWWLVVWRLGLTGL